MFNQITLRVAGIEKESIVDGPGVRLTIFVQGCPHHCKGCHNPQTHDFSAGKDMFLNSFIDLYKENPLYTGITLSGGEPFCKAYQLYYLCKRFKQQNLGTIVVYTGYTLDTLLSEEAVNDDIHLNNIYTLPLLNKIDMLVDGPFIEEQKDLTLQYRGSSNQRIYTREEIQERLLQLSCSPFELEI